MVRALSLVLVPVLAGLFVTVVMASDRGADSTFSAAQRAAGPLTAAKLEALVRRAPAGKRIPADARTRANCIPHGGGPLRNPWTCTVRYASGQRIVWRVRVFPNGAFLGRSGPGSIAGCCVEFGQAS